MNCFGGDFGGEDDWAFQDWGSVHVADDAVDYGGAYGGREQSGENSEDYAEDYFLQTVFEF